MASEEDGITEVAVTDLVCGSTMDKTEVAVSELYRGWAYYFCSSQCRERFLLSPGRYAHGYCMFSPK